MTMRRVKQSGVPTSRELAARPVPFNPFELALEVPPPRRTLTIQALPEDKQVFDELQAWYHFRHGRRLTQWEVFTILLSDALGNPEGRFWGVGGSS